MKSGKAWAQTSREVDVSGRRLEVWHFCVCVCILRAVTRVEKSELVLSTATKHRYMSKGVTIQLVSILTVLGQTSCHHP